MLGKCASEQTVGAFRIPSARFTLQSPEEKLATIGPIGDGSKIPYETWQRMTEQGKPICRHIVAEPGVRTRRTHAQTHAACSSDRNRLSAVCCAAGGAGDPVEA